MFKPDPSKLHRLWAKHPRLMARHIIAQMAVGRIAPLPSDANTANCTTDGAPPAPSADAPGGEGREL